MPTEASQDALRGAKAQQGQYRAKRQSRETRFDRGGSFVELAVIGSAGKLLK